MNYRMYLSAALLVCTAGTAQSAPLWHSIVLDDFATDGPIVDADGFGTAAGLPDGFGTVTGDSVTGRRDIGVFRDGTGGGGSDFVAGQVTGGNFVVTAANSPNATVWLQNDYGTAYSNSSSNTKLSELDLTGASAIDVLGSEGMSAYVIDVVSATAGMDVTFTVWGSASNGDDYASATLTTSGSAEELRFDLIDFTDKGGAFATNVYGGKEFFTWSTVTAYSIAISGGSSSFTGGFTASEVFTTVPEPGSMLAMLGLFGGSGLIGYRRRKSVKKRTVA